jgi:hypothetical protein
MTVGVISAQKKMLRLLTAWDENMPMMEKAMEKFLFSDSERTANQAGTTHTHTGIQIVLFPVSNCEHT